MGRLFLFFIFLTFLVATVWLFKSEFLNFYQKLNLKLPEVKEEVLQLTPEIKEKEAKIEVFTPPPLKVETPRTKEEIAYLLTQKRIIDWTNFQREKYGLEPLRENQLLNFSAEIKVQEMFEKQFFAHISPEGKEIGDLAKEVGYEFIAIGENLAMGNFRNEKELVELWMESPNHRENILNKRYQEIGVAVKRGIFEGKEVWMAVQHFGKPLWACPQPDEKLKLEIEENKDKLEKLLKKIEVLRTEIESAKTRPHKELKEKIEQHNNLVSEYTQFFFEIQAQIEQYNKQVEIYNACLLQ